MTPAVNTFKMSRSMLLAAAVVLTAQVSSALNFTVANGQIYTPGLVILDAPQPDTPLGGGL